MKLVLVAVMVYGATNLPAQVYQLDFGNYETAEGYQKITAENSPDAFDWLVPPVTHSQHLQYEAWRYPVWLDGVTGKNLAFEYALPNSEYELQLFLNAGLELTSTWDIVVNEKKRDLNLFPVRNGPEPPDNINEQVKIWWGKVDIGNGKLKIELTGGEDSVRLLGAHFYATKNKDRKLNEGQKWLLGTIQEYGKMSHDPMPLEPLLDNLKSSIKKDPDDAISFKYYWETKWLDLAEELKDMRGWQWSTHLYRMTMIQKFQQGLMLLDPLVQQPDHPLYERALWLRGRLAHHLYLEYRGPYDREYADRDFSILLKKYPNDTLVCMYAGESFKNDEPEIKIHPEAPAWSKAQTVGLERLRRLAHYWVTKRQAPNGELGGKYGDDVEALRFWHPLFYTGDSIAILGLKRLGNGVWNSDEVYKGYSRGVADVEHSSEFISDTAPTLIAASDDTIYHNRAWPTAKYFNNLWSIKDPDGDIFFKGAWYSSTKVDERPPRNRDVQMNARTMKVLRFYLWRHPENKEIRNLLYNWSKSWAKLAKDTRKGKPYGLLPASYRASDGALNGDEPNWYEANMYWPFFDFRGDAMMLDHMLFMWQFTGDNELLFPLETTLKLVEKYRDKGGEPGTEAWAAAKFIRRGDFRGVVGQWRLLTGKTEYDDLLVKYGEPYLKYRINGDEKPLVKALIEFNNKLAYNWPMQTGEAWFTDRIMSTHPELGLQRMNTDILRTTLTGDMVQNGTSPYMAVIYENVKSGFTALVNDHSTEYLNVSMFNHAESAQNATLRLWSLKPNDYRLYINGKLSEYTRVEKAGQRIEIELPSGVLINVELK